MTLTASPRLAGYAALGAAALLLAIAARSVDAAAFGVAFLFASLVGFALGGRPRIEAAARLERVRAIEGDPIRLTVDVVASEDVAWLQIGWPLPAGMAPAGESASPIRGVRLDAGVRRTVDLEVTALRWGVQRLEPPILRATDPLGFFRLDGRVGRGEIVRVYPRPEAIRTALAPASTSALSGNMLSREHGEGIEFADVRPYMPGDRPRRINWRLSSRQQQLHVNETHPERNADVVLFLDAFTDLRAAGEGTFDAAVRGASTLAAYYLRRRDRVGVVGFGGALSWLTPSMGNVQLYRIAEALIDSEVFASFVWRGIDLIPPRTLPPGSLVVALTPLLDDRALTAMFDLCARGYDLMIVEVDPEPYIQARRSEVGPLAHRVWRLQREAVRYRFRELRVPIVRWAAGQPLQPVVEEAEEYRRRARWLHV